MDPSTPQSRELQSFEAYNRRVLPQLVEASLSAAISTDLAPVEERVRALVGDILRTCQSKVSRDFFQQMNAATSPSPNANISPTPHGLNPVTLSDARNVLDSVGSWSSAPSLFYQEPPHLEFDEAFTTSQVTSKIESQIPANRQPPQPVDSGYGSRDGKLSCHQVRSDPSLLYSTQTHDKLGDPVLNDLVRSEGCTNRSSKHSDHSHETQSNEGHDLLRDFDLDFDFEH